MNKAGRIKEVVPRYAVPGGEIAVECEGFTVDEEGSHACYVGGEPCAIVAASQHRVIAIVPDDLEGQTVLNLESRGEGSEAAEITVAGLLADDMHIVSNPAVNPRDDSIVVTRSGSRGQKLPNTLYRIELDGYLDELPAEIMNPTGVAFDPDGDLYVTNRADGEVCRIERGEQTVPYATGLGIATGIAFNDEGVMFVGDRSGTIHRIDGPGRSVPFATLEPSVAAFHLAFGPDGRLYVASPGLASHDSVWAIDRSGSVRSYFRGFGRPQGLAFDRDGNLYVAACYQGHHGIVRISEGGESAENFVAVNNAVGLCFTRRGEMIIATTDAAYSLAANIYGTLLN
jgi:sugar lactone lactonase YvrE